MCTLKYCSSSGAGCRTRGWSLRPGKAQGQIEGVRGEQYTVTMHPQCARPNHTTMGVGSRGCLVLTTSVVWPPTHDARFAPRPQLGGAHASHDTICIVD